VDLKKIDTLDLVAVGAGVVTLVLSLMPAYISATVSASDTNPFGDTVGSTGSESVWGTWGVIGVLLIVLVTVGVAVQAVAPTVLPDGVPYRLVALAVGGLGTVLLILRGLTSTRFVTTYEVEISTGPGWSGWLIFATSIAFTVALALRWRASDEQLPSRPASGQTPPAA